MQGALEAWLRSAQRNTTREDVAAMLGDFFAGEREQQESMLRASVGGQLTLTPTGSFSVPPRAESGIAGGRALEPRHECVADRRPLGPGVRRNRSDHGDRDRRRVRFETPEGSLERPALLRRRRRSRSPSRPRPSPRRPRPSPSRPARFPELPAAREGDLRAANDARETRRSWSSRSSRPHWKRPSWKRPVLPPGRLTFDTVPWTEVWIDEVHIGDTPLVRQTLPAG